ncbi:FAD/NAD-P-binding domain-containing protein [Mycena sanguinolenta]|uniref:FAD/NAD-P-binding domain-containing protein n=1 Tax=Mycena sanguinolenta TaxID=230812 RepID=A0A8H6ZIN9_9AGAR|nr:FAD/NAD-P-binding domain-containing protein [Mycena sanguinolenta]
MSIQRHDSAKQIRTLLVDNSDSGAFKLRTFPKIGESLPAAARRVLTAIHPTLLERIIQDTAGGLHEVCTGNASVWASSRLDETYSITNMYGVGWHLDRGHFDETLREACDPVLHKGKFLGLRRVDGGFGGGWEIDVEPMVAGGNVARFRAHWLVDATGRPATIARKIGAVTRKHHDLLAFYAVLHKVDIDSHAASLNGTPDDNDSRTLIEAAQSGWWYSARLPHNKRVLMYTTSPSNPSTRNARKMFKFFDMARDQTSHIARVLVDKSIALYELPSAEFTRCTAAGSSVLAPYAAWEPVLSSDDYQPSEEVRFQGRGWCAVGDAALAFDSLSSQGMITALDGGAFVGAVLVRYLTGGDNDPSKTIDGEGVVASICDAYERVRVKYEGGRAYYYSLVRRFDEAEDTSEGRSGQFWQSQRG